MTKSYYLHTKELMDATDNGSASVVLFSDYELERAARLEAEKKLKLIEHDNVASCPMCEAETKIDPQPIELSGVKLTANIRQCTKCDFSWLPSREENRLDVAVIKVLEARLEKCKELQDALAAHIKTEKNLSN